MIVEKCVKDSFVVIGKEGSTSDGEGFIQKLWADANSHFEEVQPLAKKNENGDLVGIWGAMSDFSHSFNPWEDFNKGLYLAGVECRDDAVAPDGWTKWMIPGYEYLEPVFTTTARRLAGLFLTILRRFPLPYVSMATENLLV